MSSLNKNGRVLCAILACAGMLCAQQEPLTLQECFRLALQNNVDLKVADYLPQIAETDVMLAEAPYDFFVNGGYEYSRLDSRLLQEKLGVFSVGIGKRFLSGTEASLEYGMEYRRNSDFEDTRDINNLLGLIDPSFFDEDLDIEKLWTSGVTLRLTQPLLRKFGFTANEALIKAAGHAVKIADYQVQLHTNKLLSMVEVAYWRWILAMKNKEALDISIAKAREYRELVERKAMRVEGVLPSDLNDADFRLQQREKESIDIEKEIRISLDQLTRLIFPYTPHSPQGPSSWDRPLIPTEEAKKAFEVLDDAVPDIAAALEYRPERKQLQEQMKSLELVIAKNENELLPALDVRGSVSFLGEEEAPGRAFSKGWNGDHYRWSVGVAFELPLGNLAAKSQLRKAELQKVQAEADLYRLEYDIALEVRQAVHEVTAAREKHSKSQQMLDNAEKRLSSVERRYNNPLPGDFNLIFFLQDAEANRTEAKVLKNQSLFEYKVAVAQLKLAEARYLQTISQTR